MTHRWGEPLEPVVTPLASKAAAAVARPLAAHLRDRLLGTKYERDLHAACLAAAETVIDAELATADNIAVQHAVDLLVRLTEARFPGTSLLLGAQQAAAVHGEEAFEKQSGRRDLNPRPLDPQILACTPAPQRTARSASVH